MDGRACMLRNISGKAKRRRSSSMSERPGATAAGDAMRNSDSVACKTMAPLAQVPETHSALLLYGPRQPYQLVEQYRVPKLQAEAEVLVKTRSIGLNPIDWKAPDFNFAIPELPYISGRESSGDVVRVSSEHSSRLTVGDRVIAISTDYRDARKAAYQEYVVASDFNAVRLPPRVSYDEGATLGVAFVAASLALGICMGVDFSDVLDGPDLGSMVRAMDPARIPDDVRAECVAGIGAHETAKRGDWLAIWGGSATSANLTVQLARLAGLRVAVVVDTAKHGLRLSSHRVMRPDLLVDSHDPQRAVEVMQRNVPDLRFGIDTRGKDTAATLLAALTRSPGSGGARPPSPPATPRTSPSAQSAHLIGLAGLPKQAGGGGGAEGAVMHSVPIKLFHEVPAVGHALVTWLERLLDKGLVVPAEIVDIEEGLASVNAGLDRMRRGDISGGKLVVRVAA